MQQAENDNIFKNGNKNKYQKRAVHVNYQLTASELQETQLLGIRHQPNYITMQNNKVRVSEIILAENPGIRAKASSYSYFL
jgi:hypothetical protein